MQWNATSGIDQSMSGLGPEGGTKPFGSINARVPSFSFVSQTFLPCINQDCITETMNTNIKKHINFSISYQ